MTCEQDKLDKLRRANREMAHELVDLRFDLESKDQEIERLKAGEGSVFALKLPKRRKEVRVGDRFRIKAACEIWHVKRVERDKVMCTCGHKTKWWPASEWSSLDWLPRDESE